MTTAIYRGERWLVLENNGNRALIWTAGRRERWVNAEDIS